MTEIARILAALAAAPAQPAALATLVGVEGSSYRRPGARLLLLADGTRLGSISGGCLEDDIVLRAQRVLATGRPETAVYDTTEENDVVWGTGTGCQGVVRIFLEPIPTARPPWIEALAGNLRARRDTTLVVNHDAASPGGTQLTGDGPVPAGAKMFCEIINAPPAVFIFGAGDDAQPLVRLAKETGWHVTVADSRPAYATTARFPSADAVRAAPAAQLAAALPLDERSFVVVMTHRYADDRLLLHALLPRPLAYLGLLGPRKRTDRLLAELPRAGLVPDDAMRARLHAPVGLDLDGHTPEEVALSILAEMHCRREGRPPAHLRDRPGPIHV